MKKLLLLVALILSVNSFSAVNLNIDGGTFSAGTSISGGSTYTVNHSGSITYTTATSYIERYLFPCSAWGYIHNNKCCRKSDFQWHRTFWDFAIH